MKIIVEDAKGEQLLLKPDVKPSILVQEFKKILLQEAPKFSKCDLYNLNRKTINWTFPRSFNCERCYANNSLV